jgi:hypothetical protein
MSSSVASVNQAMGGRGEGGIQELEPDAGRAARGFHLPRGRDPAP